MGEYADMAMESELFDYVDACHGEGIYNENHEMYSDDLFEGHDIRFVKIKQRPQFMIFTYTCIIHETEKATLFELSNQHLQWIPKSIYELNENEIKIPEWFVNSVAEKAFAKMVNL